ncbi:MAG: YjbQ family protein [Candidatus Omnitrophica bacterium]|nr:YjbQ family protein [Candidatus Omnitrophota bacterium]
MVEEFSISTKHKEQFINITHTIHEVIHKNGWESGIMHIFIPHTTAAITINENADPSVVRDMLYGLNKIVPHSGYHHMEGNSAAHIKSSLLGCSCTVAVANHVLVLGTWQGIYFCEFDGPRERTVQLKFICDQ